MATEQTIRQVVNLLFQSPLAKKPEPLPGQSVAQVLQANVKVFALALCDLDDRLLMAAVAQYLASGEPWFPPPSTLRKTALSLVSRADGTPSAFEAWAEVKRGLHSRNPLSPLAQRAIDLLGGMREYGMSDIGDEPSWRARFIQAYEQLENRQAEDSMMLPAVTGYIEARRELNGNSVSGLIADVTSRLKPQ